MSTQQQKKGTNLIFLPVRIRPGLKVGFFSPQLDHSLKISVIHQVKKSKPRQIFEGNFLLKFRPKMVS